MDYGRTHSIRLASRTGKVYRFISATVAAGDTNEARSLAVAQQGELNVPWQDEEIFECKPVASFGAAPPQGQVFYQWTAD